MMTDREFEQCMACGAQTPYPATIVTHRYLESSAGCWARYGEILEREYSNPAYMSIHPLTVDAYAAQHPGREGPQTINSINVHLACLYAYFRKGFSLTDLAGLRAKLTKKKKAFRWLTPPSDFGPFTVNEVWTANTAERHTTAVIQWAESVFESWMDQHERVAQLLNYGE